MKCQKYIVHMRGDISAADVQMMLAAGIAEVEKAEVVGARKLFALGWHNGLGGPLWLSLLARPSAKGWRLDLQGPKAGDQ